jgi:transposase
MEREYIGIDLHKAFFQVCTVNVGGERLWEGRYPRTTAGFAQFMPRVSSQSTIAVEASGPTWAFVDTLTATGAAVWVVDPRKTRLRAGFAAKTDRLDARRLADALRRESVVRVYVPPPAIRDLREVCRSRHQLVRLQRRVVQMLRALLLRSGAADAPMRRLASPAGRAWLQQVALPPAAAATTRRLTHVLEAVHEEVTVAEGALRTRAQSDPIAIVLDQLVGIGPVIALTLRAEIGDIARFARGAHLASYAGLVTRVDWSATHRVYGRITKEGSPWLRWALVEAAMHAKTRRDSVGRWARRLTVRKGVAKARVALARRLCDDIVRVWPRSV